MTEPARHFDDEEEAERRALQAAIDTARADVAAGRVVPHEEVREWLLKLAQGENAPRPFPR